MNQLKMELDADIHIRLSKTALAILYKQAAKSFMLPSAYARMILLKGLSKMSFKKGVK